MLSFELDGDEQTLRRFLGGLSLFTLAESLGGVESLISHAATMTHAGMAPEARCCRRDLRDAAAYLHRY
ncbi:cystathionine gamma-synthase [Escherichia coli]|uniref:Cystathionine gamma-synthase n=1 Tax=Escherichia coli TaxID=562 RepID=A0A377CCG7_ECOLX|nr:cystathionine gamma-synthase [Escherichia coli]